MSPDGKRIGFVDGDIVWTKEAITGGPVVMLAGSTALRAWRRRDGRGLSCAGHERARGGDQGLAEAWAFDATVRRGSSAKRRVEARRWPSGCSAGRSRSGSAHHRSPDRKRSRRRTRRHRPSGSEASECEDHAERASEGDFVAKAMDPVAAQPCGGEPDELADAQWRRAARRYVAGAGEGLAAGERWFCSAACCTRC